jgi:two-component system, NtrC family, response regulator HydG
MSHPSVLVVDDDPMTLKLLHQALTLAGYDVTAVTSGDDALGVLEHQAFDVAVVDVRMPGMDGVEVLRGLKRRDPSIEVIMTTAHPDVETAVSALKEGAYDYLQKPLNLDELRHRMGRVVEHRFLRGEVQALRGRLGEQLSLKELVGTSPEMRQLKATIEKVAASHSAVVIEGESGTGKELVAAAIHRLSSRSARPFIPVNCGAIPAELVESEFFGHVGGACSGALSDTLGLFRSADGGTIFLDEIGELPPALQAKLLRVLQDKEARAVGSTKSHKVDVRVIAATNRSLDSAVMTGSFGPDLLYRLNVVAIRIPPLRERKADIPVLVRHFLHRFNERFGRDVQTVAPDVMTALTHYDFPGNVRELEDLLERAYAVGAGPQITAADLPTGTSNGAIRVESAGPDDAPLPTIAEMEHDLILRALRRHPNHREEAARALGMSSRTLYRRLREYGIGSDQISRDKTRT